MREIVPDSDQRIQAVTDTEHNIVLVAGAGTGKTTILVDRVLELILGQGIGLDEIVALTFTEKAAVEMKIRLGRELEEYLHYLRGIGTAGEDAEIAGMMNDIRDRYRLSTENILERAQAARVILEQAQIGTIHSFAAHILRLYPLESGISPGFRVDDGTTFEDFFRSRWEEWVMKELELGSSRENKWRFLLSGISLDELEKVARKISDFEVSTAVLKGAASEEKLYLTQLKALEKELESFLATLVNYRPVKRMYCLQRLLEVVKLKISGTGDIDVAVEEFLSLGGSLPKQGKDWNEVDIQMSASLYRRGLDLVRVNPLLYQLAAEIILPFVEQFRNEFLSEGYISFNGLLYLARELLLDNQEVRREMKKRYRAVLVDEFQDTDPIQYDIVLLLAENPETQAKKLADLELEPGKLFIVGDPKQSIYTFRRADIEAYEAVLGRIFAHQGKQLELSTNFRSHSELIDFINYSFDGDERPGGLIRRVPGFQPEYRRIKAYRKKVMENQKIELILVDNPGGDLSSDSAREGEAKAIVNWINVSVGKENIQSETGEGRPLRYSDIALLFRSLNPVRIYLEVCKANRVPYVIEGEKFFYSTQEVLDFYNLIRAIADPNDRIALAGVLRSPLGGLSDPELFALSLKNLLDYRQKVDSGFAKAKPVNTLYRSLLKLHRVADCLPLPDLIDRIYSETYIREICAAGLQGEQKLANLDKIKALAVSTSSAGGEGAGLGLYDFVRQIERFHRELEDEGESPLADETVDAVRILSIHKAKGLEFPVVIISDLHRQDNPGREPPILLTDRKGTKVGINLKNVKSLAAVELMEKEENRRSEEEKRVLYVAMTRARERLILTGSARYKGNTFLQKFQDSLGLKFADLEPGVIQLPEKAVLNYQIVEHDPVKYRPKISMRKPRAVIKDVDEISRYWKKQEEAYRSAWDSPRFLTPTGGAAFETEPEVLEAGWGGDDNTRYPAPSGSARQVGTVCHRILEEWDFSGETGLPKKLDREIERSIKAIVVEGGADPGLAREVKKILSGFFKSAVYSEIRDAEIMGREIPFTIPWKGNIMEGVIDLVYRKNGEVVVADYKTDRVEESKLKKHAQQYKIQRDVYLEAVKKGLGIKDAKFELIFLRLGKAINCEFP